VSDHTGFGSTLIKRTVGNLNGRITYEWRNDGVDIIIDLPFGTLLI
jgi:two-component sensor histidine kinase